MGTATETARQFLDLFARRDFDALAPHITPDFEMVWPGNARFTRFEDFAAWGKGRYRAVNNHYDAWEEAATADGTAVFVIGTIAGEFGDGTAFSGVRFVDRVLVRGDRVAAVHVWSDMADTLRKLGR